MSEQKLVLTFIPALIVVLVNQEKRKGSPLTEQEVLEIRDKAIVIALPVEDALRFNESRGYQDIDPDHCWEQWQRARIDLIGTNQDTT
jgi:DUF917 family protein